MRSFRPATEAARRPGFTLIELLVAMTILTMLIVMLLSITNSATRIWIWGEGENQYRMQSRALLDFIGHELQTATLAMNQGAQISANNPTLELLINPPSVKSACEFPNSIFWQAPIATDDHSLGNLAEVGYFVRWGPDHHANLCRYFVNPTTGATGKSNPNYLIYSQLSSSNPPWVGGGTANPPLVNMGSSTPGDLDTVAPANAANNYQGLFLQDVLGLWVQAYDIAGNPLSLPYDSSASATHPLPAYVVISIVNLDSVSAVRLAADASLVSTIQALSLAEDAPTFFAGLTATGAGIPRDIGSGAHISSIHVSLDGYR